MHQRACIYSTQRDTEREGQGERLRKSYRERGKERERKRERVREREREREREQLMSSGCLTCDVLVLGNVRAVPGDCCLVSQPCLEYSQNFLKGQ